MITRRVAGALVGLLLSVAPVTGQAVTAITNARVIDGLGGAPIADGVIVVQGGRIEAVGEAVTVAVPAGAEVIDVRGMTVMPGLADMHVHLVGGWDGETTDILGYQRYLNALLYAGVTTAQDVGGLLLLMQQMRQEVEAGRIAGPRLLFVGPLLDGVSPVWPPISYRIVSSEQVATVVDQLDAGGVDALKAYGSLDDGLVAALVAAAKEKALPVFADLGSRNGSMAVAETGIRGFAHAGTAPIEDDVIAFMAERGVATITTLAVSESFARHRFENLAFLEQPLLRRTMPPWFRAALTTHATRELTAAERGRAERAAAGLATGTSNVGRLHDAGVLLVAGTDSPYPGVFFGEGLHRELELLVEAGLAPLEAISVATRNPAVLMNAEREWGTLRPGLVADLIVVDGRPDQTISDTRRIHLVMQGGRVIDRDALEFDASVDRGFRASDPLRTRR